MTLIPPITNRLYGTNLDALGNYGPSDKPTNGASPEETTSSLIPSDSMDIGSFGAVLYQVRGFLGWSETKLADLMILRTKCETTVTFSEMDTMAVTSFNVTQLITDSSLLFLSYGGTGNKSSRDGTQVSFETGTRGTSESNENEGTHVLVVTKSFTLRIIASNAGQAQEIRSQIFMKNKSSSAGGEYLKESSLMSGASTQHKSTAVLK
jgi:hypothetical protein